MWSHATAHCKPASFESSNANRASTEQNRGRAYQVAPPQSLPGRAKIWRKTLHRFYSHCTHIFKGKWQKTKQFKKMKAISEISNTHVAMQGIKVRMKRRHFGTLMTTLRTASANKTEQQQPWLDIKADLPAVTHASHNQHNTRVISGSYLHSSVDRRPH
jgi:hypothetical protein